MRGKYNVIAHDAQTTLQLTINDNKRTRRNTSRSDSRSESSVDYEYDNGLGHNQCRKLFKVIYQKKKNQQNDTKLIPNKTQFGVSACNH